jgi:hypothetical protein
MELIDVTRRHRLHFDMTYLLFWQTLNTLNTTILRTSPTFDLMSELRSFFQQTRPGAVQRMLQLVTDHRQAAAMTHLVRSAPDYVNAFRRELAERRYELPVVVQESPRKRSANDTHTTWLALVVVGISLTVLGTITDLDVTVRRIIISVALVLFTFLAQSIARCE